MNCELLRGHIDIVLSLATTHANVYLLISAAKVCRFIWEIILLYMLYIIIQLFFNQSKEK